MIEFDPNHKVINKDSLIGPMVVPFFDGDKRRTMIACMPAKQVTGLIETCDDEPPLAIIAMSVGHLGIASGYNSEMLKSLIESMNVMLGHLIEEEEKHANQGEL